MSDVWVEYAQVISSVASLLMLGIWAFYTKLFYENYREQHRPWFLIQQVGGTDLEARCLLVNMSHQVAHVESVLAVVHSSDSSLAARVRPPPRDDIHSWSDVAPFREGPLGQGEARSLGTFDELFSKLMADLADGDASDIASLYEMVESVEVRVITATVVDEHHPLGARRTFDVEPAGERGVHIAPRGFRTDQMRSRKERKEVFDWFEAGSRSDGDGVHLDPAIAEVTHRS